VGQHYGAAMTTWTVIDEQQPHVLESGDTLTLDPSVLGWQRKPEGLCRDEVCIPVPADVPSGPMDAALLARLLQRPIAIDADERVAAFAAPAAERADALRSGMAPDFELPDVHGVLHRLSDFRGKKVVLYAYASW
jgi:AhpC/TSA family